MCMCTTTTVNVCMSYVIITYCENFCRFLIVQRCLATALQSLQIDLQDNSLSII